MVYLALKYAFFAVMATVVNLAAQYLSLSVYGGVFNLYLAIIIGTLVGLLTKYILDKKYIFYYFGGGGIKDDLRKFILYSIMGIATTLIFWGFELSFDAVFKLSEAKYIGAIIGLTIGYIIKYNLDKKYVFRK